LITVSLLLDSCYYSELSKVNLAPKRLLQTEIVNGLFHHFRSPP